jgi:hypothetical protein
MKQGKNTPLLCKEGPGEVGSDYFVQSIVKNDHKQIEPPLNPLLEKEEIF